MIKSLRSFFSILIFTAFIMQYSAIFAVETYVRTAVISDLSHEINEADFIHLSQLQKVELILNLKKKPLLHSEVLTLLTNNLGPEFQFFKFMQQIQFSVDHKQSQTNLMSTKFDATQKHSIEDVGNYVENRIGKGSFIQLQSSPRKTIVIGGDSENILNYCKKISTPGKYLITPIPSLYSHWGIYKYEISDAITAVVHTTVWVVPPSLQYVKHYAQLFSFAVKSASYYMIDEESQKNYKIKLQKNAADIFKKIAKPDYLVFGYSYLWKEQIQNGNEWEIVAENIYDDLRLGQKYTSLTLRSKNKTTADIVRVGLITSDQTIWGELASFNIQSYFHKKLKGVFFLGSAGSTSASIDPYSVSAPREFTTTQKSLSIPNLISPDTAVNSKTVQHFFSNHGNTFSPIEQNKSYLHGIISQSIGTLDVEQSIIAETIQDYNLANSTKIQFGAVNVITDKPIAFLYNEVGHSHLDKTNTDKKSSARITAVQLALSALRIDQIVHSCKKLFY